MTCTAAAALERASGVTKPAPSETLPLDAAPLEFALPPDLEAHEPPEARGLRRDGVRLLVTHRDTGAIVHARFADLPEHLAPGDLLIVNDSATLPAALRARRSNGTAAALHLSTRLPAGLWIVEPREVDPEPGETLELPDGARARLLITYPGSRRLWIARLDLPTPLRQYLGRHGRPIAYPYVRGTWPLDAYQTVYAREPGSAEMPSAGRAFTPAVLARAARRGIGLAHITLHAGVASPERHEPPAEEWYRVPSGTAAAIRAARRGGRRVVAVGTTVVRALESAATVDQEVIASEGWTDLVVTPQRGVRAVDALLTGFHEPRASHLAMLEAFAGRAHLAEAYRAAIAGGYLWHEFGDLHLIQ
ncbi:MAG TPA: S-adenosylmethionine:tRNA ribosyltransferase-isomerase [bacterium]|nr:S-adenosylmethionine:tRNA ribosyltransferase-isomerase [bacterium]